MSHTFGDLYADSPCGLDYELDCGSEQIEHIGPREKCDGHVFTVSAINSTFYSTVVNQIGVG